MLIHAAELLGGLVLLLVGGQLLVRGAVGLANRLGVPPLLVGLTILAWGTSAPELFLNTTAALEGHAALSFGNVVGATIANIGLILGIGALIRPIEVDSKIIRTELPITMLFLILVAALGFMKWPGHVEGYAPIDGAILLLGFGFYAGFAVGVGVSDRRHDQAMRVGVVETTTEERAQSWWLTILFLIAGGALLKFGGDLTVNGATFIATNMGIPSDVVGLTIVSVGTTLPELMTTIIAQRRGQADMAVGNILGSCIFNTGCIFGVVSAIDPVPVPPGGGIALIVMCVLAALVFPLSRTFRGRIVRTEGVVLLAIYAGFTGYQVWRAIR